VIGIDFSKGMPSRPFPANRTDSDGMEILPIRYDDNYVTVFPHESRTLEAVFDSALLAGHTPCSQA
jgi:hypothetical protein